MWKGTEAQAEGTECAKMRGRKSWGEFEGVVHYRLCGEKAIEELKES